MAGAVAREKIKTAPAGAIFVEVQALFLNILIQDDAAAVEVREKNHILLALMAVSTGAAAVPGGLNHVNLYC